LIILVASQAKLGLAKRDQFN